MGLRVLAGQGAQIDTTTAAGRLATNLVRMWKCLVTGPVRANIGSRQTGRAGSRPFSSHASAGRGMR